MKHVFPVNVNEKCRVILTEHGANVLNAYYRKQEQEVLVYKMQMDLGTVSKGQVIDMQLWELMHIFGKHLFVGADQVFKDNKLLIEKR